MTGNRNSDLSVISSFLVLNIPDLYENSVPDLNPMLGETLPYLS
jgi:hypothetical protein